MSNNHKISKNKKNGRPRSHRIKRKLNRSPYFRSFTHPKKIKRTAPSLIPYDMKIVGEGLRLLDYQLNGLCTLINKYSPENSGRLVDQIKGLSKIIKTNISKSKATSRKLAPFQIRYENLESYVNTI